MSAAAPDQTPDRRRLMILLAVLGGLVLLAAVYFLFLSGGGEADSADTQATPTPVASETAEPETTDIEDTEVVVLGTSNRDPFAPVVEDEGEAVTEPDKPSTDTSAGKKDSPSTGTTKNTTSSKVGSASDKDAQKEPSGADSADAEKEKDGPVTPEVVSGQTEDGKGISVKAIEVHPDYVVARVSGDRTRLYVGIPGVAGVMYVAPLGADCAWFGSSEDEVRVSLCEGETERL
jgi:hypothetical protein